MGLFGVNYIGNPIAWAVYTSKNIKELRVCSLISTD